MFAFSSVLVPGNFWLACFRGESSFPSSILFGLGLPAAAVSATQLLTLAIYTYLYFTFPISLGSIVSVSPLAFSSV